MRSFLYLVAKLMGDINAVKRGRIGERIFNRSLGRLLTRLFK
jgi:hypothetical protein